MRTLRGLAAILILWTANAFAEERLSYDKTLDIIRAFKSGVFTQEQTVGLIRASGVDFTLDKDREGRLRALSPGEPVLRAIRESGPKIAPPPPVPTTGELVLRCAPAECEVKLNGQPAGTTSSGALEKTGLSLGDFAVDFGKPGYITQQKIVKLSAAEPRIVVAVELVLSTEGKAANGKALLGAMLRTLGAAEGLDKYWNLTGDGSMKSYTNGNVTDWDFAMAYLGPGQMELSAKGSSGLLGLQCAGQKCEEKKKGTRLSFSGKQLKGPLVADLETNLRGFFQNNLPAVLAGLGDPSVQASSLTADETGAAEQHLHVEAGDFAYDITLGMDLLPSIIAYAPKSGLGGLTMTFGDYFEVDGVRYPKRTVIRLTEGSQNGIEVRLGKIMRPPTLNKK